MSTDSCSSDGFSNDGDESIEALKSQGLESESSGELTVSDNQLKKAKKTRGKKTRAKAGMDTGLGESAIQAVSFVAVYCHYAAMVAESTGIALQV